MDIMIVDDDDDFREALGLALGAHGHQVESAQDGVDALARLLDDLVAQDLSVPTSERVAVGLFAGVRRWEFSGFVSLRRDAQSVPKR